MQGCKHYISNFNLHIYGLSVRVMQLPRNVYHNIKRKKNKNLTPTILCNNCTGGMIYHDLGLKFNSPTINTLFYSLADFVYFINHIKNIDPQSISEVENFKKYPVGAIHIDGRDILIGFVHYKNFDEGKTKWIERFSRIQYDNLYVIYEGLIDENENLDIFTLLPYKKVIISSKNSNWYKQLDYYIGLDCYKSWYPGKILDYKNIVSLKRNLDDFDYLSFLNQEV